MALLAAVLAASGAAVPMKFMKQAEGLGAELMAQQAPEEQALSLSPPVGGVSKLSDKERKRHLRYTYINKAGMGDRLYTFDILVALGKYHNATVHLNSLSPRDWLTSDHSQSVSSEWDRYFETFPLSGPLTGSEKLLKSCKTVQRPDEDLFHIFDGEHICAELPFRITHLGPQQKTWWGNIQHAGAYAFFHRSTSFQLQITWSKKTP